MEVTRIDLDEWREGLPATGFEPFHLPEALSTLADHTPGDLELYGGYKGEQLVAMVPLFVRARSVGRAVFSPPPSMGVPRLGPLVMPNSPKQRSRDKVNEHFVGGLLDAVGAESSRTLLHMICGHEFDDPRPFQWRDFRVQPSFTYRLALEEPEDLIMSFSSSLRKEIRSGDSLDVEIAREGVDGARIVYDFVERRYAEQDKSTPATWPFIRDLVEALDDRVRVYVAREPDGTPINGQITLCSNDTAYYWLGGTAHSTDGVSTNSLLQWRAIRDIAEAPPTDSIDTYDFTGANYRSISEYKSAFSGDLVPYYTVESGGTTMDLAKHAYRLIPGRA